MRPRDLTLVGFRSYADETSFSWDARDFVGIVGPIGSGKSSILDGIAFALYNQTPRSGRLTKSLINQRRDSAQVSLTFEVDGLTYKAVRSLRRSGASAHALYRVDAEADVELTDSAGEMVERIEALLGLDFSAFQRSVLLAQNQFAEFLEATGGERDQVLKGVFGFDRLDAMRDVAKGRLDALGGRLAVLADRRATAASDREDLERRRVEFVRAEERAEALEALRAPFEETKQLIVSAERRESEATQALERLDGLAMRIPGREATDALFSSVAEADEQVAGARREHEVAADALAVATRALDEVLARHGGREGIDRAGDAVAAWRRASERDIEASQAVEQAEGRSKAAEQKLEAIDEELEAAGADVEKAAASEGEARAAVDTARAAMHAAQQEHRAHALRSDLTIGQPCPVCEQIVSDVPGGRPPQALDSAEEMVASALRALEEAAAVTRAATESIAALTAAREGLSEAVAAAAADAEAGRNRRDDAAKALAAATGEVADLLGDGDDPPSLLARARAEVADAEAVAEEAKRSERDAQQRRREVEAAAQESAAALASLRTSLASLAGTLDIDLAVGETHSELEAVLERIRTEWLERRSAADDAQARAGDEAAAGRAALAELLEAAELGAADDLADVIAAAVGERSAKEAEVSLLEQRLGELEKLAEAESEHLAASELLRRIHSDLAPSRFLEFVLDERRRVLSDLASEHFEMLSAGRYRFDDHGEFDVVDLSAADAVRSPASLSGGETFLASLALALALAEIVAREGGRLDAFFLDEGFGSLDPEHLDLAMSGVERLVTGDTDRLVVIVSHVPALTDRIEDLIRLDRDPITGNTIVLSGSGAT